MKNIQRSLADLLGEEYITAVCRARAALTGEDEAVLLSVARERENFYPESFALRQEELMGQLMQQMAPAFETREQGAPSDSFRAAQHNSSAPLNGFGCFRLGEDGRLYFAGKSEHYHIPLGHSFPGYNLIEKAKRLGIPNATHNNTRGFITRTLERRLVAAANGVDPCSKEMEALICTCKPGVLNRVINLETGSLAVEAALKMMLSRFYPLEEKSAPFEERIPVFLVMADNAGGITGNYHGTTIFAQTLRGLWPKLLEKAEENSIYHVESVPINDAAGFARAIAKWNTPPYKTAGFCHEIILMNYGGIRLREDYLQEAYRLCRESDTPVLCDEIQSCAWYDGLFLFRHYGLTPDFVSIGKGFPGGCYPASKVLASATFDSLSQFGALVTNGQEELASLAYLITMEFIAGNGSEITSNSRYYHEAVCRLALDFPEYCSGVEGDGMMTALCFDAVDTAVAFCRSMNTLYGIDISAQTYKPNCPPVALTKLPIITTKSMTDHILDAMRKSLKLLKGGAK